MTPAEQPLNTSTSTAETKARQYYRSCMDEDKLIEKMGDKPLQDLLRDLGGWNISTRWEPTCVRACVWSMRAKWRFATGSI